ncbi:unnamed protein product [Symbiodinium natans]|uniref:Uncharacterized protein n=1 Tax=Symbiodinium natans TaxID=878477 RepID=A0A812KPA0_9DINO|nr:unnamed protein product [Symbiodinium natans]
MFPGSKCLLPAAPAASLAVGVPILYVISTLQHMDDPGTGEAADTTRQRPLVDRDLGMFFADAGTNSGKPSRDEW